MNRGIRNPAAADDFVLNIHLNAINNVVFAEIIEKQLNQEEKK